MRRVRFPSTSANYAPEITRRRGQTVLFVGLALVPLVASVIAVAPGWLPVGDDATIAMRGRDLFTGDTPLLGMPSAVGQQTGRTVHHPGPLELWWVGLWVRGLGFAQASLVAASLVWAAGTAAALVFARKIGGAGLLALTAVIAATLTWSLRGEVPVTPFNVHVMVMPMAAYVVAMLAWHAGVRWAGVGAIVLGSWSAQAHLTAVGPVVTVGVVVVAAVLLRRRRSVDAAPVSMRSLALGAGVFVTCWVGPILDVVINEGGNVRAVLGARSDLASEAIGMDRALEIVVNVVSFPPVWATAGAHPSEFVRSPGVSSWLWFAAVLAVGASGAVRRRRSHPALAVAMVSVVSATFVGAVLAARFPSEYLSLLALHNHLWLWPLSALLWGVAAVTVGLEIAERVRPHVDRPERLLERANWVLAVVPLVVIGAASVGAPHRNLALAQPEYVRTIGDGAIARLDPDGTYRVTISGGFDEFFVELGLLSHLEDAGLDVVGPSSHRDALGDRRTTPSGPVDGDLVVVLGWEAAGAAGPGELLGTHVPPDDLLARRSRVEDRLVALLRSDAYELPLFGMSGTDETEIRRWLRDDLAGLVIAGLVPDALAGASETETYVELRREPILHASVYLAPDPDG